MFSVENFEEVVFMRIKEFLGIRKLTTRDICVLGMLIALTVILGIFLTFRPTDSIKVSTKFISVFVASCLFGPLWGGFVGAAADILSFFFNPVGGAWLWQITLIEFLYGFVYGIFFYKKIRTVAFSYFKIIICTLFEIVILHYFLTSFVLLSYGYFPDYKTALTVRLIPAVINLAAQIIILCPVFTAIKPLDKMMKGSK